MDDWKPIETAPKSTVILVFYKNRSGKGRIVKAAYVEKFTEESNGDYDEFADYNEATDCYYTPEGWYEYIDNWDDFSHIKIGEGTPTHWMPLPKPPEEP
jgi:hypothetical protein